MVGDGGGRSEAGSAGGRSASRLGMSGTGMALGAGRSDRRRAGERAALALLAGRSEPSVVARHGVAAQTFVSVSSRAQGSADPRPAVAAS
jgi:hypothetical protein